MPKQEAVITKTRDKKFRVRYYAANGEMLAVSEVLNTKANANKNIKAMANIFATRATPK